MGPQQPVILHQCIGVVPVLRPVPVWSHETPGLFLSNRDLLHDVEHVHGQEVLRCRLPHGKGVCVDVVVYEACVIVC